MKRSIFLFAFLAASLLWPGRRACAAAAFLEEDDQIRLENSRVALVLDKSNGFFREIINRETGIVHQAAGDGSWPFRIFAGQEIRMTAGRPQKMEHSISPDGRSWTLRYADLLDVGNNPTGVALALTITLEPEADFFVLTAALDNKGSQPITGLVSGDGELLTGDTDRSRERLTFPGVGSLLRRGFLQRTFGFPPGMDLPELGREFPAVPDDQLGAGWLDYSGRKGGIGIGYLDRRGPAMVFQARSARPGGGVRLTWRLFDLEWGYWHNQLMNRATTRVPLPPGSRFETGEWIIAPHAGDWHRMADIYRERYEKHFAGDTLAAEQVPARLRECSLIADFLIADQGGFDYIPEHGPGRKLRIRFADIPARVESLARKAGVPVQKVGVKIAGQMPTTWGFPDFFPLLEAAGGTEGARRMTARLKEMGAAFTLFYTNPWYNNNSPRREGQPAVKNHVKEAVVSDSLNAARGPVACLDNSAWQDLWRNTLLPAYREIGADGIYFDEGALIHEICGKKEPAAHRHGVDALGILGGPVRGLLALHQAAREIFGPGAVVAAQGANDLAGRWLDAWQFTDVALRYTHPGVIQHALIANPNSPRQVYGAIAAGAVPELAPGVAASPLLVQALAVRERMVKGSGPGYPDGFRDNVGLAVGHPNLVAKAFRQPGGGITVVYYAREPLQAALTVDGRALDNPRLGVRRKQVRLEKDEIGFWMIR